MNSNLYIDFLNILKSINLSDIEKKIRDNFFVIFVSDNELYFSYCVNEKLNICKSKYKIDFETYDFGVVVGELYYNNILRKKIIFINYCHNKLLFIDEHQNLFSLYENKKILLNLQYIKENKLNNLIISRKFLENYLLPTTEKNSTLSVINCEITKESFFECQFESIMISNDFDYFLDKKSIFRNSKFLEKISFYGNLISVNQENIFKGCQNLSSIEFPNSLTYIDCSFESCKKLQKIIFNSSNILNIISTDFIQTLDPCCKIYVKDNLYDKYLDFQYENKNYKYYFYKISEL